MYRRRPEAREAAFTVPARPPPAHSRVPPVTLPVTLRGMLPVTAGERARAGGEVACPVGGKDEGHNTTRLSWYVPSLTPA
ncbi:hypothetical protein GCM10008959_05200 [Deinococcus seoulensis]|uniref:Ig-like domain-containing protein n=2 Tax=Deinococcus TaxID=1298 RepID=A0ABQ2RNE6_9DEIO|nr:hypothetical protein GCM10008959_05200 [Deinococcus seoulensis]GGS15448.1 hypothetical protein GCM10008961_03540 [Deinococcus knuensis]